MGWGQILLLTALAAGDPRISIVEHRIESADENALLVVEQMMSDEPTRAKSLGLDYLRGLLLLDLEREQEALKAFVESIGAAPELAPYARYRLAVEQDRMGHPEVAAGLVATLLAQSPPRSLIAPSARLLRRTISRGGDCRLLNGAARIGLRPEHRRQLDLAAAECATRAQDHQKRETILLSLLEENRSDEIALLAARLLAKSSSERTARAHLVIGLSFYNHREFDTAIAHLARAQVKMPSAENISRNEAFECRYALARSHFWRQRFRPAAAGFASLLPLATSPERRAQLIYQRARCLELAGDWQPAIQLFESAFAAEPKGRWADAALIASLRLHWLSGAEDDALAAYRRLIEIRKLSLASRSLLFLASTDLVSGRSDRATGWLSKASRASVPERSYWSGRAAELEGDPTAAVSAYAEAAASDPFHPFGRSSLQRLSLPALRQAARRLGAELATSSRISDLHASLLLLGNGDETGELARRKIQRTLARDPAMGPFLQFEPQPPESWPLWQSSLRRPEEMLLALGIFEEGGPMVLRHFPVAQPSLAFTGSLALARAGDVKRSLYVAEILDKRIPDRAPTEFLPTSFRQLLFPFRYSYPIVREARRHEIDPFLLTAIIREESRFDPTAFSGASARGLTQFIFTTARRIATKIGAGPIEPEDLEDPELAIALGAAYLAELSQRYQGSTTAMVAAYNAGEFQADLWRAYCKSGEPEELLTKIAFAETRAYVTRVLTSGEHYRDLYGPSPSSTQR